MTVLLARADARALPLRDGSVQTCVTSPPFWGLRSYQTGSAKHLELGSERTPEEYVEHMVKVFREVRRALRDDGTLWLEIGDSYATRPYGDAHTFDPKYGGRNRESGYPNRQPLENVKHKDLVGVPWLLAFALRADGWYLRQECIWHRGNPMPEAVRDRPARAHSTLFLLSKASSYYYDTEAVKEKSAGTAHARGNGVHAKSAEAGSGIKQNDSFSAAVKDVLPDRNMRSVWQINTSPYKGAHYATFPPRLVEPCILASTSARGACPKCGAPWERVTEKKATGKVRQRSTGGLGTAIRREPLGLEPVGGQFQEGVIRATVGWRPGCSCDAGDPRPCIVLDPFCGTATVAQVAIAHGRRAVCFDLSSEYLSKLATKRTHNVQLEMTR